MLAFGVVQTAQDFPAMARVWRFQTHDSTLFGSGCFLASRMHSMRATLLVVQQ